MPQDATAKRPSVQWIVVISDVILSFPFFLRCDEFFHSVELDAFVDIAIVNNVSCYPEKHGTYGWCWTKPEGQATQRDWGFCFYACQNVESRKGANELRAR